jgi:hypothetical protein
MLPTAPKQLMLSGVLLLAVSNVNNPVGLVGLPYVMWSVLLVVVGPVRTDHDQRHCYHHVPTVNQRRLLQFISS